MMGDIIQFPNAYRGNDRYEIQRAQELAWLDERIPAVQAKLNQLHIFPSFSIPFSRSVLATKKPPLATS